MQSDNVEIKHPAFRYLIIYDYYNICELVTNFKIAPFQCRCYEASVVDTSEITVRRKKPLVDLLSILVQG